MNLQEFVSQTLKEIIGAVQEAQTFAETAGAQVNPEQDYNERVPHVRGPNRALPIKEIEFDVAVTSTDTSETQAGAGIFVAALGIGVKDKSDASNSCVSRIKFSVPIVLPVQSRKST